MTESLPVWQQPIFQQWQHMVKSAKVPHAILLHGAPGLGKSHLMKAMLQHAWCDTKNACGHCRHCRWLLQDTHPDVMWLKPEAPGKALKIDAIREANAWLQLSPLHTRQKVLVVQAAENLNTAASNALLKTLEEPPETGVIFLISEMPQQLLATVRSRCYKMPIALPDEKFLRNWLKENVSGSEASPLPPGLGPYALVEEFSGEKKQTRSDILRIIHEVQQKKVHFLTAAENLKNFPPLQILEILYEVMLQQISPQRLDQHWFDFETQWLSLKRSLLNNQNLNWQLQLELLLEKL